ncbi:flagellin [Fervidicella metallireducens AeB]|uniref:Flagellin n=1 Tax=Fervidicella metallireducens AeB TaxID=1403537 RepID=A0A017RVX8_9CLOT|nr:flagellar hook-associated protein FlgL [Fervidicella metallireducens]EYE88776.1 flagellin [Fervidicella metallireducens AeB]
MRITNKVLVRGYLGDLSRNLEGMRKYEDQLSSGHEIRRPSDDPFRVARTMELTSSIAANERYGKNIEEGLGWVNTIDTALGQIGDSLQTVREKMIAAGGAYSKDEREAVYKHVKQIKEQIVQIANSAYDGRYVFAGDKTTEPPFQLNDDGTVLYKGSKEGLIKEMSPGVKMDIGISGSVFSNDPSVSSEGNIFKVITDVLDKLKNNESPADLLGDFDKQFNEILRLRADIGAKQNRLGDMKEKNESENFNMTELLSKTYDIDVAKKYMEFKVMESVYQASLNVGTKILQPSMLDYLR